MRLLLRCLTSYMPQCACSRLLKYADPVVMRPTNALCSSIRSSDTPRANAWFCGGLCLPLRCFAMTLVQGAFRRLPSYAELFLDVYYHCNMLVRSRHQYPLRRFMVAIVSYFSPLKMLTRHGLLWVNQVLSCLWYESRHSCVAHRAGRNPPNDLSYEVPGQSAY